MDDSSLNELLHACRERTSGSLPPAFAQDVWRKIRLQKAQADTVSLPFWTWILRPQGIFAVLTLALTLGVGMGSQNGGESASKAHSALHLEVFGGEAPALPSTLLSNRL